MNSTTAYSEKEITRLIQLDTDPVIKEIWFLKNRLERNRMDSLIGYQKQLSKLFDQLKKYRDIMVNESTVSDLPKMSQTMMELKETIIKIYSDLANDMKRLLKEEVNLQADLHAYEKFIR